MADDKNKTTAGKTHEASGAPVPSVGFDAGHPAVVTDTRAGTTELQNRIDFNDPGLSAAEAVAKNLEEQSKG